MHKKIRFFIITFLSVAASVFTALIVPSILLNLTPAIASQNQECFRLYKQVLVVEKYSSKMEGVRIEEGRTRGESPKKNDSICFDNQLTIDKGEYNWAHLAFMSSSNQPIKDHLAAAGGNKDYSTWYRYPSRLKGLKELVEFVIAWGIPGEAPRPFTVIQSTKRQKIASATNSLNIEDIAQKAQQVAAVHSRKYCSVVANSGKEWSVKLSEELRAPIKKVCEQAIQECQVKTGEQCSIVNHGDWESLTPNAPKVNLLLKCANKPEPYYRQGTGPDIEGITPKIKGFLESLEQQARADKAEHCVMYLYGNDDVLVSPSPNSQERTLIYMEPTKSGFIIHDLVGTVTITPSGDPKQVNVRLNPGERYIFIEQTDKGKSESIPANEREAILNRPLIQTFLNQNNWNSDNIRSEIGEYQKALEQFYQSPAVQVEEIVVNGVPIWKTTIDLNNPETLVALVPKADVAKAGGLARFAKSKNAAIIASGTYGDEKGKSTNVWTMKSEGRFIGDSQDFARWSTGTVLGLKRGNQPEMVARAKTPQWDQYWFALTGHPRLVSNGVAGVTEVAPDETLNIRGSAGRAAIGFSSKTKTLYHVITKENISIDRLAKVMLSIGCDEAMNLEGGNGRVLAHKGTPLVSGEVRSPLIVVYDAQNPPPQSISDNWTSFHASDRPSVSDR